MAAVCGTSGIASLFSQAAFAADSDIADGQTQRFDFSILQSMAHDLAQTAWRGAPRPLHLPDFTNESGSSHRHKKNADLCIFSQFNNWIINKYCLE